MKIDANFESEQFDDVRIEGKGNPLTGNIAENQRVFDAFPEALRVKLENFVSKLNEVLKTVAYSENVTNALTAIAEQINSLSDEHDKDYVKLENSITQKIAELVGEAPETLDTLEKIANALGENKNDATKMLALIGKKVEKEDGKGLSTNDYTDEEKEKLENIKDLVRVGCVNNVEGYTNFFSLDTYEEEEPLEGILYVDITNEKGVKCYIWLGKWVEVSPQINLGKGPLEAYSGAAGAENEKNINLLKEDAVLNAKFLGTISSVEELNGMYYSFLELETEALGEVDDDKYFSGSKVEFLATEAFLQTLGITTEECPIGVEAGLYNYGIRNHYTQYLEIGNPYAKLYRREWGPTNDEASLFGWVYDFTEVTDFCKKTIGEKSKGENSAIFGSTSNKLEELELPDKIYYKPIAEEYYYIKIIDEPVFTTQAGQEVSNMGSWVCLVEYNVLYQGELYAVAENKIYKVNVESDSVFIELEAPTDVTYYNKSDIPVPDGTEIKFYETEPKICYKFENLTFTTDENDTPLEKLYTYTDKWGNKCYTVYEDYTPDIANGTTKNTDGTPRVSKVYELTEDKALESKENGILYDTEGMLKGLRYEALFNAGTYFAVADGENSFSSGEDNVASGDDTFSVGYRNIVLADGSTALGRRILVRGVGANGFGLNGKATGRYAIVFNEGGQALGYASLAFGDHCKALNYYDVAGGFNSIAKGNTSIAFGRNVVASGFGAIALGQLTVADGRFCIVGGNQNECFGDYSFVAGLQNIVNGTQSIVGGLENTVDGNASIVCGMNNTNKGHRGLIAGSQNTLEGNDSAVIGTANTNKGRNGSIVAGQLNVNEGERSSVIGGINNYISKEASDSLAFGSNITVGKKNSLAIGTNIQSDNVQCWIMGRRLKTARDRQIILGIGNEEDSKAMLIIGAGSNNDTDTNAVRLNALTVRQNTAYVEIPKLILVSPNKNKFMLKVSDDGTLSTERMYY